MSNTLLIIEDNQEHFDKIKTIFEGWQFLPENHEDISYDDEDGIVSYINDKICTYKVSAIIMDISLEGNTDEKGLKIIKSIRDVDDPKNKIIPIYCYSQHGEKYIIRSKAFTAGVTNIFSKNKMNSPEDNEVKFLKQSLTALSLIYAFVSGQDSFVQGINKQLQETYNKVEETYSKVEEICSMDKVNLQILIELSSYQNIVDLTEINDTNEQIIINVIGQTKFDDLKQAKWGKEDSKQQKKLIENIDELVSTISVFFPVLLPFVSVFKLVKLFVKMK